jgi:acetoacetate decarboxylase
MEKEIPKYFSLPFTRSGNSSIIPPPPWIYGIETIASHVIFDKNSLIEFIPEPLEIVDGEGWIYIANIISVSNEKWNLLYEDPELTQYMEGAIAIKVKYNNGIYTYFPFMWVDKDWPLFRGLLMGYPKKIAKVSMSKFNPILENYSGPKENVKVGGYVSRNGDKLIKLIINLKEKVNKLPFPFGPIVQFRRFPAVVEGNDVFELVQVIASDSKVDNIWYGDCTVELRGGINDEVDKFKIEKILGGYYYNWYLKQLGTKVLHKLRF